jgi:hypothetical protein
MCSPKATYIGNPGRKIISKLIIHRTLQNLGIQFSILLHQLGEKNFAGIIYKLEWRNKSSQPYIAL